jgi:molecular chaperone GrpE (heat shock protein)
MSDDPDTRASEARGAELRENIALTDARRAEEEQAKAEKEAEKATKEAEKLKEQAARDREKAERLHAEAERERHEAPRRDYEEPQHTPAADAVAGLPGVDKLPPAAQRPEVLIGAAFAGSFMVAQILKRIFD